MIYLDKTRDKTRVFFFCFVLVKKSLISWYFLFESLPVIFLFVCPPSAHGQRRKRATCDGSPKAVQMAPTQARGTSAFCPVCPNPLGHFCRSFFVLSFLQESHFPTFSPILAPSVSFWIWSYLLGHIYYMRAHLRLNICFTSVYYSLLSHHIFTPPLMIYERSPEFLEFICTIVDKWFGSHEFMFY